MFDERVTLTIVLQIQNIHEYCSGHWKKGLDLKAEKCVLISKLLNKQAFC